MMIVFGNLGLDKSPPSRRRGLKLGLLRGIRLVDTVASLAEAWIEIIYRTSTFTPPKVASLAEAWIEMHKLRAYGNIGVSPPSRRRGLKYYSDPIQWDITTSPPSRRRGLK